VEQLLRRGGHKTIRQNGLPLVEQGVTTQDELDRVCGCMEGGEA
jgi:type II secretory ATPase GspE/PulE/Tfp pilus assembly ATPase PilB-like protein